VRGELAGIFGRNERGKERVAPDEKAGTPEEVPALPFETACMRRPAFLWSLKQESVTLVSMKKPNTSLKVHASQGVLRIHGSWLS
jgi:hypothetical protein